MATQWWHDGLRVTGFQWLQDTSYSQIDHVLCSAFVEKWQEETSCFHLPFGEVTVTLDDVSCLLHLHNNCMILSDRSTTRAEAIEMMIEHLGADPRDTLKEVTDKKGGHARFSYLRIIFKERLLEQLQAYNEYDMVFMRQLQEQALRIYFLYLLRITLFTSKSVHYVDVSYLKYFRDLELAAGYAWGAAALSHLYMELSDASHYNTNHLSGYLFLL